MSTQEKSIHPEDLTTGIRVDLEVLEAILSRTLSSRNRFAAELIRHSQKFQGKRLRPILLFHSARLFGEPQALHHNLAAVIEIIHNATLLHDDVLDEAGMRRRVPSLNHVWGNEAAVLLGDFLFARAYSLLAAADHPGANRILSDVIARVCEGELSQVATKFRPDLSEADYMDIIRKKTALLFGVACRFGALDLKAPPERVEAVVRFGEAFGIAFQIIDDCLDLAGTEAEVGKSLGTDLEKGKLTLPLILLLGRVDETEAAELRELLADPEGGEDRRCRLLDAVRRTEVVEEARERANRWITEARSALSEAGTPEQTGDLEAILEYSLRRRR